MTGGGRLVVTMVVLLAVGCGGGGDGDGPVATEPVPIPEVDLSSLEEAAQQQLRTVREELEAVLAMPGVDDGARSVAYGRAGVAYHAYGFLDSAEAAYVNAQALAPRDVRWPYYLGHVNRVRGRIEQAIESFERASDLSPGAVPILVHLGLLELDRDRPQQAALYFERALESDPGSAAAVFGLGKAALAAGDHATAAEKFEKTLELDPSATEVQYSLGLAYRGLGREDEAVAMIESRGKGPVAMADPLMQQLQQIRGGWRVHQDRGVRHFQEGDLEAALAEFELAAEAAPEEPTVQVNLGSALSRLGRFREAVRAYEAAIAVSPGIVMAQFNLGTLAARFGHDAKAVEHYEAALAADPGHANSHFNLANALRRIGRHADAVPHYRIVIEADPANPDARRAEVFALLRLERYGDALERLEQGVAALPDDDVLQNTLVRVLAAAPVDGVRDGKRALELGQQLVDRDPGLGNMVAFAQAAAEAGQFAKAAETQLAVLAAVRQANPGRELPDLEADYRRYLAGEPSRIPWPKDDPRVTPRPLPPPDAADPWAPESDVSG